MDARRLVGFPRVDQTGKDSGKTAVGRLQNQYCHVGLGDGSLTNPG